MPLTIDRQKALNALNSQVLDELSETLDAVDLNVVRAIILTPPNPGVMPSPTSGCPNTAFSEQMRISQLIAISQPPPSAKPFTAAITGTGKVSSLRNTSLPFFPNASPSAFVSVLISPMSAPATKDFSPAPVRIIARTTAAPRKILRLFSLARSVAVGLP